MANKLKVYFNKADDVNPYGELQWQIINPTMTGGIVVIYKEVTLPYGHQLVRTLTDIYNSRQWQEYTLNGSQKEFYLNYFKNIGLDFVQADGGGYTINTENDRTKEVLCKWRVELDTTDKDRLFRLSPFDFTYPNPIYAAKLIDSSDEAKAVISEAMDKGLIGIRYMGANA
jgi:hypothetical protein